MVMPICSQVEPQMSVVGEQHAAACHLLTQV
jgi:hypothetical protein